MTRSRGWRPLSIRLAVEALEDRQLLSGYTGPTAAPQPVLSGGAIYQVAVTGGGFSRIYALGHGQFGINLLATTPNSTLVITLLRPRPHSRALTSLNIGRIHVNTGQLGTIAAGVADLNGPMTPLTNAVKSIQFQGIGPNAKIDVNGALNGLTVGTVAIGPTGHVNVAGNLAGPLAISRLTIDGGSFTIGNDATGPLTIGSILVEHSGKFSVKRDLSGGLTVANDLVLATGGNITVGRELDGLTVHGNLIVTPDGGAIAVGGDLNTLTIAGALEGKGKTNPAADLSVGLNLNNLTVLGGGANLGGIQHANINVAKNLAGLDVRHGIFNSFLSAGVLIDGGAGGPGGNIGPDGADAVFDSDIRAGVQIKNLTINGDVKSDFVTNPNPTGFATRIVAGEDRQGKFTSGGNIDNFQVLGALIDAVLAASVAPSGGNGMLPDLSYGATPPKRSSTPGDGGFNTYDQPFGHIVGGTFGHQVAYQNYSEASYSNETFTGITYNPADPTIDDFILPGAINASFASPPTVLASPPAPNTIFALPTKPTVFGGVISTPHGDNFDYAGIFAADTRGVFIGPLPS